MHGHTGGHRLARILKTVLVRVNPHPIANLGGSGITNDLETTHVHVLGERRRCVERGVIGGAIDLRARDVDTVQCVARSRRNPPQTTGIELTSGIHCGKSNLLRARTRPHLHRGIRRFNMCGIAGEWIGNDAENVVVEKFRLCAFTSRTGIGAR
ncbi:unannotated protein [freshwater metagenome]|uniref:Unannotated protein n=1 Tax=freshwater metagenome TaxID=449393 RepID=A0A6J6JWK7_9ZZZZ